MDKGFGLDHAFFSAAAAGDINLLGIPLGGLLRNVRVAGGEPARLDGGNVDVVGWPRKHHGVFSNFVVVESHGLANFQPGVEAECGNSAMVAMTIEGPLGQERVGLFGVEESSESLVVWRVNDGATIILASEEGSSVENAAGVLSFGGADRRAAIERGAAAITFTPIEVEEHDLGTKRSEAGDGTCATAFGVAGVTAGNHDFAWSRRELG